MALEGGALIIVLLKVQCEYWGGKREMEDEEEWVNVEIV